eukprot:3602803-Prymnesium_polylepis.1
MEMQLESTGRETGRQAKRERASVFYTASLQLYVYQVRCPCLWDIVSCRVNRMHDAMLLALRHCWGVFCAFTGPLTCVGLS